MLTARLDVQRDVFAMVKISTLMFAMLRIRAISVQCCTLELLCLHCQKICFAIYKDAMFGLFPLQLGAVYFCTGVAKRHSAKQRHIIGEHDIRTKQNGAHESTAALQQRYTDPT